MKVQYRLLLGGIIILAGILRLWNIASNPPSLTWDEVSIGYNAYSVFKTGKDEHGRFLPIDTFVSYGDYKPPFAIYATIPSIALFGLNEFGVRFPSALAGIIAVGLMYFVTKELLEIGQTRAQDAKNSQKMSPEELQKVRYVSSDTPSKRTNYIEFVPFFAALFLATSPWHVNLSRAGWEANIGLTLLLFGVYLALKSLKNPIYLFVTPIPFVCSIYTFNSTRYVAPLLCLGLLVFGWSTYKKYIIQGLAAIGIGLILMIPIVPHLLSKEARLRFTEVNIFTDQSVVIVSNERLAASSNAITKFFSNRRVGYTMSFVRHFFDHLDTGYLYMFGDGNPKFSTRSVGELYLFEAPLVIIGAIGLLAEFPTLGILLFYWLVISFVPAAVARETPHALRTINSLPVWEFWSVYGLYVIIRTAIFWSQKVHHPHETVRGTAKWVPVGVSGLLFVIYFGSVTQYLYNYHTHYVKEYAGEWEYGYKQAVEAISSYDTGTEQIFITEQIGRAYMYTLFYTQYDPALFLKQKKAYFDAAGFYHVDSFGRYYFGMEASNIPKGSLLVLPFEANTTSKPLSTIALPNGVQILSVFRK